MKILVTGSYGQVGQALMRLAGVYECEAIGFDRDRLDITDQQSVQTIIAQEQPDAVINAAAYTAVDHAEDHADAAHAINATAVGYLAKACADHNIPFVHFSTDYVFDGKTDSAYREDDPTSPLGVYGKTKLAGEHEVRQWCDQHYILRTSWVFSESGNNFVKTMLRLGCEREQLSIVSDQTGKPTSADTIANITYTMLTSNQKAWGTYHVAQPDSTSWFCFAETIFAIANQQGNSLLLKRLHAIPTHDYPTPAARPANSTLNCNKLEHTFNIKIAPWKRSLNRVVKILNDS